MPRKYCRWKQISNKMVYQFDTDCGFQHGGLSPSYQYCPYCGHAMEVEFFESIWCDPMKVKYRVVRD